MKFRTLGYAAAAVGMAAALGITQAGSASASNGRYWISAHSYTFVTWSPSAPDECLDDSNTGPNGKDNLRVFTCNSQVFQRWTVVNLANGWAQLENEATGRCLDYSLSSGVRTFPCGLENFDGGWQKWALVDRYDSGGGGIGQVLKSAINQDSGTNTCLDISLDGVLGLPCSGARQDYGYQSWSVVDNTPGY